MSSVLSGRGAQAGVVVAVLATCAVLAYESRVDSGPSTWFEISAGLGLGSQAGVEHGWFGFDARTESLNDSAFEAPIGAAIGAGPGDGVFTFAPLSR